MGNLATSEITDKVLKRLAQISNDIESYIREDRSRYGGGGLPYNVDEEESSVEGILRHEIPKDFPHREYMIALKYMTNDRTTYPQEWIRLAMTEVFNES